MRCYKGENSDEKNKCEDEYQKCDRYSATILTGHITTSAYLNKGGCRDGKL